MLGTICWSMVIGGPVAEIKSGWQTRKRRVDHPVRATLAGFDLGRRAPASADSTRPGVRGPELHDKRTAHVLNDPSVVDDARCQTADADGEWIARHWPAALGRLDEADRELGKRALLIASHPAWWQRVLHGQETMLREEVTAAILAERGAKSAFRYGACGLGDLLVQDKTGVHTAPMGCGHRLCPRCGRTKGRPMIKRVFQWLAVKDHGDLFTMVLTQRVVRGESLPKARARLVAKEQEYLSCLRDAGLISGISVAHMNWSVNAQGWHYHVHLLLELPKGVYSPLRLRALWRALTWGQNTQCRKASSSLVAPAGLPDGSLLDSDGDPDFWSESKNGLAAAVQYPVRDIAQGISSKRIGADRDQVRECVVVLLKHAKGWKLRRTIGQWRKKPPDPPVSEPEGEKPGAAVAAPGSSAAATNHGTVHRCMRVAQAGSMEMRLLFAFLETSCRNDTDFGRRFVTFCRSVAKPPST